MTPTTGLPLSSALVAPHMAAMERVLSAQFRSEIPHVDDMLGYARSYSGKQLRPALVFTVGHLAGGLQDRHVRLGAVVEMIHLATLVHDDVLDRASLRRNTASVNARWDNKDAILLGDVIFARAIRLLTSLGSERALDRLTGCVSTLCEGEIHQNRLSGEPKVDEETYLSIIRKKTASLYGAGCELAALFAGADDELVGLFRDFGFGLGTAFQVIDDCLDLTGDEGVVGKSLGTDIKNGKMTLPLIHLLSTLEGEERQEIEGLIRSREAGAPEIDRVRRLLEESGSIDYALSEAEGHVDRALEGLASRLEPGNTAIVREIAGFVLRRRH